ncbi:MAG: hypothetical protein ACR2I6_02130 [Candidatus Planktophila sp.]
MKKVISFLVTGLLVISPISANAATTSADVDYSKKISTTFPVFQKAIVEWGGIAGQQPSLIISPKYKSWKAKFIASSNNVSKSAKLLNKLKGTEAFAKSDPLLHETMGLYLTGVQKLIAAVNKNDTKAMAKANDVFVSANNSLLAWQNAYQAEVDALNK